MTNETYNGWTNYATWRINLELIDTDYYVEQYENEDISTYDLSLNIKSDIIDFIEESETNPTISGYALAFVDDVDFYQIAEHIIEAIKSEKE